MVNVKAARLYQICLTAPVAPASSLAQHKFPIASFSVASIDTCAAAPNSQCNLNHKTGVLRSNGRLGALTGPVGKLEFRFRGANCTRLLASPMGPFLDHPMGATSSDADAGCGGGGAGGWAGGGGFLHHEVCTAFRQLLGAGHCRTESGWKKFRSGICTGYMS